MTNDRKTTETVEELKTIREIIKDAKEFGQKDCCYSDNLKALVLLDKAKDMVINSGAPEEICKTLNVGIKRQYEKILRIMEKDDTLTVAPVKAKDAKDMAIIGLSSAKCCKELDMKKEGIKYGEKALIYFEGVSDPKRIAQAEKVLAKLYQL